MGNAWSATVWRRSHHQYPEYSQPTLAALAWAPSRCLVPATSFCEWEDTKPRKTPTWFALSDDRPLFAFAGIWTPWNGTRGTKAEPVTGEHRLYGFLTTDANTIVKPIHPKAMPVILTTPEQIDVWMNAPWAQAAVLQKPLIESVLKIVARGAR